MQHTLNLDHIYPALVHCTKLIADHSTQHAPVSRHTCSWKATHTELAVSHTIASDQEAVLHVMFLRMTDYTSRPCERVPKSDYGSKPCEWSQERTADTMMCCSRRSLCSMMYCYITLVLLCCFIGSVDSRSGWLASKPQLRSILLSFLDFLLIFSP